MTAARRSMRSMTALLAFAAAACLSSAPPAPPVRWFDPLPAMTGPAGSPAELRVVGPDHLGRDFAVRVGERELAFDTENRWVAEPQQLVATVLARALAERAAPPDAGVAAELELFELDVTASPRAHVRVHLRPGKGGATVHTIDVWAAATDRSPASFAAAMAKALADVAAAARSGT